MSILRLVNTFYDWREAGKPMVLATVVRTEGSTYSKAGRMTLFDADGEFQGLVSGGCLEGDLAEHASTVVSTGTARMITYDMRDRDEDEIWGLGLGCDGAISLLLTSLDASNDYQPFAAIARNVSDDIDTAFGMVTNSSVEAIPVGASVVADADAATVSGLNRRYADELARNCRKVLSDGGAGLFNAEIAGERFDVLYHRIPLPLKVLVLGAGPDAPPLLRLGIELGWRMTTIDHRPAYISKIRSLDTVKAFEARPESLSKRVDLDRFDAAVVMSHHLHSDRVYLQELTSSGVPFIGVLGPPARRERLLADLGDVENDLRKRIYGPVGLDIGADSPESIALAIVAQIHAVLSERDGTHLDKRQN